MIPRRRRALQPGCDLPRPTGPRRDLNMSPSHDLPPPGTRVRLGLPSDPAHLQWPLSLRNQGKACCSSSRVPKRSMTPRVLAGINAATVRSRLPLLEGRAGMWCSPVPAAPRTPGWSPASAWRAAWGRPEARGPGQGPTVAWAQPGCPGFFPPSHHPKSSDWRAL